MMTPTSSYFEECSYVPTVPGPGKLYRIHLKDTDKVITVMYGKVVVQSTADAELGGGWIWACMETGNWLGFRNYVSGTYLGRCQTALGVIHAGNSYHSVDDCFCVRQHPDGGYVLLLNRSKADEMQQVGLAMDGETLVAKYKGGALWLFEEV